ncbi:MAG: diaminopimelate decarboxylase, partial [Acidobacteriota bacterium]
MSAEVFYCREGKLHCESCSVGEVARSVLTPFYVYSSRCLQVRYRALSGAFSSVPHLICYALKANAQPALLEVLKEEGAGAEVVSAAELALALEVGFAPEKIVFSGVGKTEAELLVGLRAGVLLFTVESEGELVTLERLAAGKATRARVALRVNPDIDPGTHPHIATGHQEAKFGVDRETALGLYARRGEFRHLDFSALHAHIGSQITTLEPLVLNARFLGKLAAELRQAGVPISELDIGGGLGIAYGAEGVPRFEDYAREVLPWVSPTRARLILEPGRALVGPAGALVIRVLYVKSVHGRSFAVVDAGMNDFLRPALYDAYHRIVPVTSKSGPPKTLDVVGAVCESSDVFGRERRLVDPQPGDLLAVLDAGAYGYAMSSNYNLRPRPAEVLVEGNRFRVIRRAESVEELVARERG